MTQSGYADLPLHGGKVPGWLLQRMESLTNSIIELLILEYGNKEVLRRISDPFWFQSLGSVIGMDWHSSGVTTCVMGVLKSVINKRANEFGLYVCGGKGKHSSNTPHEILTFGNLLNINSGQLVNNSKLVAKIDNNAIQDGFQLYLHSFIFSKEGEWSVIQQGLNAQTKLARRYHWHSENISSFTEQPHTFIYGKNQGQIINLTDKNANPIKNSMIDFINQPKSIVLKEIQHLSMPAHHQVTSEDINLKRLGALLSITEQPISQFEDLLMLKNMGPKTLRSLALVTEIIYGKPIRFNDPARFSFAVGGKDGYPYPVHTHSYDETIHFFENAIQKSKLGATDKLNSLKKLHRMSINLEKNYIPNDFLDNYMQHEKENAYQYGGKTVFGDSKPPSRPKNIQYKLDL